MWCPCMTRAKDKDVFSCLSSSARATQSGRHSGDSGLEVNSVKAICSLSQLDGQRALRLPEPLLELQNVSPWGGLNQVRVGIIFC
jgi:hypothetical protein